MRSFFVGISQLDQTIKMDKHGGMFPPTRGEEVKVRIPDKGWTSFDGVVESVGQKHFTVRLKGTSWKSIKESWMAGVPAK